MWSSLESTDKFGKKIDGYNVYSMFIQNDDDIFSLLNNKDTSFKETLSYTPNSVINDNRKQLGTSSKSCQCL